MKKENIKARRNISFASDWFDMRFGVWFLHDNEAKKLKELICERKIRSNPESFSYRIINHWQEYGLIEDKRPDGKGWRKFSVSDIVWLHILTELRKFGYSIENLKKVKKEMELLTDSKHKISEKALLDFYILHAMGTSEPVYLLAFQNGEALLFTKQELELAQMIGTIDGNYISINISELAANVFPKSMKRPDYYNNLNLNEQEEELVEFVRTSNVHRISVELKNGAIVSMDGVIKEEVGSRLSDLLKLDKFQEITIKSHKGSITKVERKIKRRPSQRDNSN